MTSYENPGCAYCPDTMSGPSNDAGDQGPGARTQSSRGAAVGRYLLPEDLGRGKTEQAAEQAAKIAGLRKSQSRPGGLMFAMRFRVKI